MKFLDSFVKSRKTYTNITPRGTHFISNVPKTKSILQKSKPVETINSISAPSEMLKSLSPFSILSSSSSVSSSPILSSSPNINENSSLMQPCIKSTPENKAILSSMQPCIKSMPENEAILSSMQPCIKSMPGNKKKQSKNTIIQEADEVEKSLINLSSIMSQHFSDKQKMDEDDVFGSTIAYQLRKIEEPRKTQLKGKIMKILYEF